MTMTDPVADMLTRLRNANQAMHDGVSMPSSKQKVALADVLKSEGYINEFEYIDDHRAGKIVVELNGRINKCGVISPRYDLSHHDIEEWVGRLLPSRLFGTIVMTTSSGIMDHEDARRRKVGGKVLGFFY